MLDWFDDTCILLDIIPQRVGHVTRRQTDGRTEGRTGLVKQYRAVHATHADDARQNMHDTLRRCDSSRLRHLVRDWPPPITSRRDHNFPLHWGVIYNRHVPCSVINALLNGIHLKIMTDWMSRPVDHTFPMHDLSYTSVNQSPFAEPVGIDDCVDVDVWLHNTRRRSYIPSRGQPRLRNDLYCVVWKGKKVKLAHLI